MTAEATRRNLVSAAERLFAEHGVDRPSLREISRTAGQRNSGALQYHFGERDQLLRAVIDKHGRDVDGARAALLHEVVVSSRVEARTLAGALVLPLAAKLDDRDGGVEYLQIMGEVVARRVRFGEVLSAATSSPSMRRWSKLIESLLPPEAVGHPLHRRFAVLRFSHAELASRARERRGRDHRLFVSHLVDLVTAMVIAPVSDETRLFL